MQADCFFVMSYSTIKQFNHVFVFVVVGVLICFSCPSAFCSGFKEISIDTLSCRSVVLFAFTTVKVYVASCCCVTSLNNSIVHAVRIGPLQPLLSRAMAAGQKAVSLVMNDDPEGPNGLHSCIHSYIHVFREYDCNSVWRDTVDVKNPNMIPMLETAQVLVLRLNGSVQNLIYFSVFLLCFVVSFWVLFLFLSFIYSFIFVIIFLPHHYMDLAAIYAEKT